jgi:TatD DNase family protein
MDAGAARQSQPLRPSFVDTHAHLDDSAFDGDRERVLAVAAAVGVTRVVNIGYRPERWHRSIALAERYPCISFTLGLHPHHADEFKVEVADQLWRLLDTGEACALGEIGLDLARDSPPLKIQQTAFAAQLELARTLRLPVVIHQRAAERDLMDCLADYSSDRPVILHSFDGSSDLARFGLDRGYWFGVGGLMTRAGSAELRSVIAGLPLDRLLLETDSPYLVPAGVKDRRNVPANIPYIAARLAELLNVPLATIAARTTANAEACFGLPTAASTEF